MYVLLITRLLRGVGRWARKPVNHTSWVAVVTPTDRPKSVRNRSVIELFCGVFNVVTLPFWHFCWCMGFCHRTESNLAFFSSKNHEKIRKWFSSKSELNREKKIKNDFLINQKTIFFKIGKNREKIIKRCSSKSENDFLQNQETIFCKIRNT